jgi:hypothetical protein
MSQIQFCPFCGRKLRDDSRFCSNCGHKLPEKASEYFSKTQEINSTPAYSYNPTPVPLPPIPDVDSTPARAIRPKKNTTTFLIPTLIYTIVIGLILSYLIGHKWANVYETSTKIGDATWASLQIIKPLDLFTRFKEIFINTRALTDVQAGLIKGFLVGSSAIYIPIIAYVLIQIFHGAYAKGIKTHKKRRDLRSNLVSFLARRLIWVVNIAASLIVINSAISLIFNYDFISRAILFIASLI